MFIRLASKKSGVIIDCQIFLSMLRNTIPFAVPGLCAHYTARDPHPDSIWAIANFVAGVTLSTSMLSLERIGWRRIQSLARLLVTQCRRRSLIIVRR